MHRYPYAMLLLLASPWLALAATFALVAYWPHEEIEPIIYLPLPTFEHVEIGAGCSVES
jgi:hypothetical protein